VASQRGFPLRARRGEVPGYAFLTWWMGLPGCRVEEVLLCPAAWMGLLFCTVVSCCVVKRGSSRIRFAGLVDGLAGLKGGWQ
jgi:hypothetical protein